MNNARLKLIRCFLPTLCAVFYGGSIQAQSVDDAIDAARQLPPQAAQSQQQINQIDDATTRLFDQYQVVAKQVEGLKVYNAQLQLQIDDQNRQINNLDRSIDEASTMGVQIAPVMVEMIESLKQFIGLDLPFHLDERRDSIARLEDNLGRSDITSAEKFRQILEVFKIETDYGLNIETYTDTIVLNGTELDVNIFRVGRVAMMYQTLDEAVTGAWSNQTNSWETIDAGDYKNAVSQGIRIAKKQAAIDILSLPVAAPQG
jgi:hypothetical protein